MFSFKVGGCHLKLFKHCLFVFLAVLIQSNVQAAELEIKKVTDNVYAIVGPLTNRTPENLGNNATFGFVMTDKGVVLIDSGGTYKGAKQIHDAIKTITDKSIVKVINTGGQDHRFLGNGYFKALGAEIIASNNAVEDQKTRLNDQFSRLEGLVGEDITKGTDAVYATTTFDSEYNFQLGDITFEIKHTGQAHTPGDSFVWLPKQNVMFTGDIVYTERMLGVGTQSNSKTWVEAFEAMAEYNPEHVVPGHGKPTTLQVATADTYDYLKFLRASITDFIDEGEDIADIGKLDQSQYDYLFNHESLAGRNAQQVYTELEFE